MFIIYINDIFFALKGISKFPDNTTPYLKDSNLKSVLETLEQNSELAVAWFEMNYIKLNSDKCHLLISRNENELITLDNNQKFDKHVSNICPRANRKLSALTRVPKSLPFKKRRILLKAFIELQFEYCPLV